MRSNRLISIVLVVSLFFQLGFGAGRATAASCDWTSFTKNAEGNRIADGCGPKDKAPNLLWKFATDARVWSSPVVSGNYSYIKTETNRLYCVDIRTGKSKWDVVLGDVEEGTMRSSSSTALIYDGKVYIGSYDTKMYCLDALTGVKKWTLKTNGAIWSSPVVDTGRIYFGSNDDFVYCVDAQNGNIVWTYKTGGDVYSSATFNGDNMYIGSHDSRMYCLNKSTGSKVWDIFVGDKSEVESSPTIAEGKIFIGTYSGSVYCLDANRGIPKWVAKGLIKIRGSLLVYKNKVFVSTWSDKKTNIAKLVCLDINKGEVVWTKESQNKNQYLGSAAVGVDGNVVYTDTNDTLLMLDALKGTEVWRYKLTDTSPNTYPVVVDKRILVSCYDKNLYCFGDGDASEPSLASRIDISCASTKIDPCMTLQLKAKVFDQFGQEMTSQEIAWGVDDPQYGSIDEHGVFKPSKLGKTTVTCKCGQVTQTIELEIIDFLTMDKQQVTFENLLPDQQYTQTLQLSNASDLQLDVLLTTDMPKVFVTPALLKIEPGKTESVKFTYNTKEFKINDRIEFKITAKFGECAKTVAGLITTASKIDCIKADLAELAFGKVSRGESKSLKVKLTCANQANAVITCDNPWVVISKTNLKLDNQPADVEFSIIASALPAGTKFTANVTVKVDSNSCNALGIPVSVETDAGITLKLQVDSKTAYINNIEKALDVPPTVVKGRTMVPLRFVSDAFGSAIEWNSVEQMATITRAGTKIILWVGKNTAIINGNQVQIDAPPVILGGRLLVPLRFISEPFGAAVEWNALTRGITIIWPKP